VKRWTRSPQRVAQARVEVDARITGEIGPGLLVFVCAQPEDTDPERNSRVPPLPLQATLALATLTGLVFLLGVYPTPFWNAIVAVTHDLG